MVIESLRAADFAGKNPGISLEVIDVRCLNPLDFNTIAESVRNTRHLLVADDAASHCGFAAEIIARVTESGLPLNSPPVRITHPDCPSPSSAALAAAFYPTDKEIFAAVTRILGRGEKFVDQYPPRTRPVDVPNFEFPGPF